MRLVDRLKQYERNIVFLTWGASAEYGKINYVGSDFIEFEVLNTDKMEYTDKIFINSQLILEVVVVSVDISRIAMEYAGSLPSDNIEKNNLN